jgi:hypothetical protein
MPLYLRQLNGQNVDGLATSQPSKSSCFDNHELHRNFRKLQLIFELTREQLQRNPTDANPA